MKIHLLVMLLALSLAACKYENCEDIKEGEVELSTSTRSFAPYADGENVVLENAAGEQLILSNEIDRTPASICTKYICNFLRDPYSGGNCRYIEAESIRNLLTTSNNDVLVEILATFEQYEEESERSYELVRVSFGNGERFNSDLEYLITEVNFTDIDFDRTQTSIDDLLEEKASIELLERTFTDVFVSNEGSDMAYFQANTGLIALKLENELWVVQ